MEIQLRHYIFIPNNRFSKIGSFFLILKLDDDRDGKDK